jgi:hypothetical protein
MSSSKTQKNNNDKIIEVYLSPFHLENGAELYPGPKFINTPSHGLCPGARVKFDELQMHLLLSEGFIAPCPLCKKMINFKPIIMRKLIPNCRLCDCDVISFKRKSKYGKYYYSCMKKMSSPNRCRYYSPARQ